MTLEENDKWLGTRMGEPGFVTLVSCPFDRSPYTSKVFKNSKDIALLKINTKIIYLFI